MGVFIAEKTRKNTEFAIAGAARPRWRRRWRTPRFPETSCKQANNNIYISFEDSRDSLVKIPYIQSEYYIDSPCIRAKACSYWLPTNMLLALIDYH